MNPALLLQRILGAVLGVALFIAAFVFASVLLAIAASLALVIWGWLWWRTREIRRATREGDNVVIEGEYRVEHDFGRLDDRDRKPPP